MTETDAVELVEKTPLAGLADLATDVVYAHVEFLGRELPGPVDLYQRWERQQWSASEIDFDVDRWQWEHLDPALRQQLAGTFGRFFFGEQVVTDTLSPLVMGAPDEDNRLFLSTQQVDEARHSFFFSRFYHDVLGVAGGLRGALAHVAEVGQPRDGYGHIFDPQGGELVTLTDAVRREPRHYARWVQAITLYHLMIEALLALPGQRQVLRLLRANDVLPGFRAGFTAVTRDESRHVSYGVWALRRAVRVGHEADVRVVVDRLLPHCLGIRAGARVKLPDPRSLPPTARFDPREQWTFSVETLTRRLRLAGIAPDYVQDIDRRAWELIWGGVARYEEAQREEHPVRRWERGEVPAAAP